MAKAYRELGVLLVVALLFGLGVWRLTRHEVRALPATLADLETVHAGVKVGGGVSAGVRRLRAGDELETDGDGRARMRLDDGTSVVIDRATRLSVGERGLRLEQGRLFVLGAKGARTTIELGQATATLTGVNAGVERRGDQSTLYAATGELPLSAGGKDYKLQRGEQARVSGATVTITPAKVFEDWTGGLAVPWGASGAPRRAVGELWGRAEGAALGDPGSPLTIRSHDVSAVLDGEVATTRLETTWFNGGSDRVVGDYRLAIPPGALVEKFAWQLGDGPLQPGRIGLADRARTVLQPEGVVLEWAGEGWLRGSLPGIAPGATVTIHITYVEWLSPRKTPTGELVAEYRYPMAAAGEPPLIGEFSARLDAGPARPAALSAGLGAAVKGATAELRKQDFLPVADWVAEVSLPPFDAAARLYVAAPDYEEELKTVLVRTELPPAAPEAGATVVLVVDSSGSAEPALLNVSRAFVGAVLGALGARDRVLVLAADQTVRAVGPAELGPADDARKKAITAALARLEPGGATDLGRALEAGADALPADAPSGLVVYVGDGWPTVGDPTVDAIQARLARRAGGAPRLGAVAVGPLANRAALSALSRGSGPLLEIADASDAGAAASALVAEALRPTAADVTIELGPEIEQVYPRRARAVVAGDTVSVVGKMRGAAPNAVILRWRDAKGAHAERRLLAPRKATDEGDLRRRWAAARVEDILLTGKGREAATDVALRAALITPWTAFTDGRPVYPASDLDRRLLESSGDATAAFVAPASPLGALSNIPDEIPALAHDEIALSDSLARAAARVLGDAGDSVRACRDSRAALRPELSGSLAVSFEVGSDGRAKHARVVGDSALSDDPALNRCVEVVVMGLVYPTGGVTVRVNQVILLPPPRAGMQRSKCSETSKLPLPLRRGVWRERLEREGADAVFFAAQRACELPTWSAQRVLLELLLNKAQDGVERVRLARVLDDAGAGEAAAFLRREAVRRAASPDELARVRAALIGDERYPVATFRKRYREASSDEQRLEVLRTFLAVAPHDPGLRRRLLLILEALGRRDALAEEVRRLRVDPFADAALLAEAASALRRIGDEGEARRTFGELAERAPSDPWARAFLGDRLRNEGWFDDATAAYAALDQLMPDDAAVLIRLALADAGADRVDIARRMLARVAQTGGRSGDGALASLAEQLASVVLAEARAGKGVAGDDRERLLAASLELERTARGVTLLAFYPAAAVPLTVQVVRGEGKAREELPAEISAPGIGVAALSFDPDGAGEARVSLTRPEDLPPSAPTRVRLRALVASGSAAAPPKLVSLDVDVPATGKPVEVAFRDGALVAP
ncbi:MAG: tetratricopeptide repeat protein [Sorangiineae bacterium]|nr:tetratricopeptide repeat protein [Sorangiineae bacterium]